METTNGPLQRKHRRAVVYLVQQTGQPTGSLVYPLPVMGSDKNPSQALTIALTTL